MASLTNDELALNHQDGLDIISALQNIGTAKQDIAPATLKNDPTNTALQLVGNAQIDYEKLTEAIIASYKSTALEGNSISEKFDRHTSRGRQDITSRISELPAAIASLNPQKYGFEEGDHFAGSVHTIFDYILFDYNHWYGAYNSYAVVSTPHWGVLVNTKTTHVWNASGKTAGGYAGSDLHAYLTGDVLTAVKEDMAKLGLNLISNSRLYSNAVTDGVYGKMGNASGASTSWAWSTGQQIAAPTEAEIYGVSPNSSSLFDTGEGFKQGEACRRYRINELIGNIFPWLRDVVSSSNAANVSNLGDAGDGGVTNAFYVLGLIGIY